jgi:hypothetical protein
MGPPMRNCASEISARWARLSGTTKLFKFQTPATRPRSRGRTCPRFAFRCPPDRREQGMPDARCTRGLVCKSAKESAHERTGQRRTSDIPCAMALRLISRSPRGIGLSCPRRLRKTGSSAPGRADSPSVDLTPTIEASGPHDFAVRFGTARRHVLKTAHGVYPALPSHRAHDALASTASHPNVR